MKLALIGEKLGHSYSKLIHGLCGLDYELVELSRGELERFVKSGGYDGYNVTIPYKKDVFALLDGVSDIAKRIGAVNTVVRGANGSVGYNTDYHGVIYALGRTGVEVKGRRVAILGTGGASRAAAVACEDMGAARIDIVGRSSPINYTNCYEKLDPEILINATPVGMFPNGGVSPVEPQRFASLKAVFDCIYNPNRTELLRRASASGIKTENGLAMLVGQAMRAQELWTGEKIGPERYERIISEVKKRTLNIALIGMPGSGKTTVGQELSRLLQKPFVDTDELVFKNTGRTPERIIRESGEQAFRDCESVAVKQAAAMSGAIIACGGGAALREENVDALKANGAVIYIRRELSKLSSEGRPLSQSIGAEALFASRKAIYESAADITAENNGDIADTVREVANGYEDFCNKRS